MLSKPNIFWQRIDRFDLPLTNSLALRIYANTEPHILKIADLQKGFILVHKGVEIVGEGMGFGVPILICGDETYFSATSKLYLHRDSNSTLLRKDFHMDRIARNTFRTLKLENKSIRAGLRYLSGVYQRHSRLRTPMLSLKQVPLKMGFSTVFTKTRPKGTIIMTCLVDGSRVRVTADFSNIMTRDDGKIFIMNEQGAAFLTRYRDSNGATLYGKEIDAWNVVEAEWASITDKHGNVGFRVKRAHNSILRRGREVQKGILDWVGAL